MILYDRLKFGLLTKNRGRSKINRGGTIHEATQVSGCRRRRVGRQRRRRAGDRSIVTGDQLAHGNQLAQTLDTIFGGAEYFAQRLAEMTDQKFQVRVFAGGEIVPPLQVLRRGAERHGRNGPQRQYYYVGKDPTFGFDCTMPFGINERIDGVDRQAAG